MRFALEILIYLLRIYIWIIIIRVLLSWIRVRPTGIWLKIYRFIMDITEPFLGFFRKIIPSVRIGGVYLDLSVIVAVIAIQVIIILIRNIIFRLII